MSIRRLLVARVEELHKPPPELSKGLRLSVNNSSLRRVRGLDTEAVDVVLEGALISLSQCLELVRPAGLHLSSVPRSNWIKAYYALDHTIDEIRKICKHCSHFNLLFIVYHGIDFLVLTNPPFVMTFKVIRTDRLSHLNGGN